MKYDSTDRIKGMATGEMGFEDWRNGERGRVNYSGTGLAEERWNVQSGVYQWNTGG